MLIGNIKTYVIEIVLRHLIKEIVLELISIPGWDNKSFTISTYPFLEA
mgnify:CR=1 FL=1